MSDNKEIDDIVEQAVQEVNLAMIPVLPLRDAVVYPGTVWPLFIGREKSLAALNEAMNRRKSEVILLAQRNPHVEDPSLDDLYNIGTLGRVRQIFRAEDGMVKVLVEGVERVKILRHKASTSDKFLASEYEVLEANDEMDEHTEVLRGMVLRTLDRLIDAGMKISEEVVRSIEDIESISEFTDTLTSHISMPLSLRQSMLEESKADRRLLALYGQMQVELDILETEKRIRAQVRHQMDKSQREFHLNEQLKAIRRELGHYDESDNELDKLAERIEEAKMPEEAKEKALSELKKLRSTPAGSSEASVSFSYIETLINLPWSEKSRLNQHIVKAAQVLDRDHYGLERVKERILEFLAVQKRKNKLKGPILCLVGPPGVGKTSLGESIAKATGREYVRMALGGLQDESEIRGHRRTYIGALPGKIVQNMTKAKVKNPLFLLDEIDKMANTLRGDPASALLEVLDPEQNYAFVDNYVELGYDLSDVLFVATANSMDMPPALLDRMEIIRLSGYTEDEKTAIALNYLVPKEFERNGIKKDELEVSEEAVRHIIRHYTREAGVRSLNREIAKICRKVVLEKSLQDKGLKDSNFSFKKDKKPLGLPAKGAMKVDASNLSNFLGVQRFEHDKAGKEPRIGQVTGLAWTEVGGEVLVVEAGVFEGKGSVVCTGKLGEVMKESVSIAWSVVRANAKAWNLKEDFYERNDVHVHFPDGATPKDGPSAGIAITTALASVFTGIRVRSDVAMTGEITLRGEVLPIGGLKEKLIAAAREGLKVVLIPKANIKDLEDIPANVKQGLDIRPVEWIGEVLEVALEHPPVAPKTRRTSKAARETVQVFD